MAATSCTNPTKKCRKCQGTCPPCRPWRCKYGKGRSLEECANDMQKSSVKSHAQLRRTSSEPINIPSQKESLKHIGIVLSSLSLRNDASNPSGTAMEDLSSSDKSSGVPPGFLNLATGVNNFSTSNEESSSNGMSTTNTSSGLGSPANLQRSKVLPIPQQMTEHETSHIFLAIAADPLLVQYSKTVLDHVTAMPEIPEINSLNDSRCIWPHTVHLTIHSFGKVLNMDIPRIADYCKQNIQVIEPFQLNITGLFHHQKLYTIGYAVEKRTVEPIRLIKMNMSKWFKKGTNWDGYTPVLSLVRTQGPRGAKYSCAPLSKQSINIILQKFGGVRYVQNVIPGRDIQLCLARSSTETTFYKNLLS